MNLLLKKMYEMKKKPQSYHPLSQKFYPHPGCSREVSRKLENKRIQEENDELIKRLEERKYVYGPYSYNKTEPNFQRQRYYRAQILKRGCVSNPFLNYVTPREFQRNFLSYLNTPTQGNRRNASENKTMYNSTWSDSTDNKHKPYSASKRNKIKIERIQINANGELV